MTIAMLLLGCTSAEDIARIDDLEERVAELEKAVAAGAGAHAPEGPEPMREEPAPGEVDAREVPDRPVPPSPMRRGAEVVFGCEADGDDYRLSSGWEDVLDDPERALGRVHMLGARDGGVKIVGVRPGSGPATCGFETADTVLSVNGNGVDSEPGAFELFDELSGESSWLFVVERRGQTMEWTVRL
jgi:hypothetical protein